MDKGLSSPSTPLKGWIIQMDEQTGEVLCSPSAPLKREIIIMDEQTDGQSFVLSPLAPLTRGY
jgi:hypothetical protein